MDKFTVEQVERCLARREHELVVVKRHYGPEFVQNPHYDETNAMLRAYAARLREDGQNAKDAARYRQLRNPDPSPCAPYVLTVDDGGLVGEALDAACDAAIEQNRFRAAMREQGEG